MEKGTFLIVLFVAQLQKIKKDIKKDYYLDITVLFFFFSMAKILLITLEFVILHFFTMHPMLLVNFFFFYPDISVFRPA